MTNFSTNGHDKQIAVTKLLYIFKAKSICGKTFRFILITIRLFLKIFQEFSQHLSAVQVKTI